MVEIGKMAETSSSDQNPAGEEVMESPGGSDSGEPVWSKAKVVDGLWKLGITGVLFFFLFREELVRLVDRWRSPDEMHGFLIPLFSLYFVYQERARLGATIGKPSYVGFLLMLLSLGGYLFFFFKGFGYPRVLMMIGMLGGVVLQLCGWRIAGLVWLPVLFLIFAIPLPAGIYSKITMPMRELASIVAAVILNALPNVQAEAVKVVIHGTHLSDGFILNVVEACSGMRLLRTFVALGVAMAYLEYRPIVHRLVLVCSTIPIAIFCNMVRVLLTGIIRIYLGEEYIVGTLHTLLGMSMLLLAFGLYGLLAWIMNRIYLDEEEDKSEILVVKD
ncbi:exosortase/archaeosortase family protein [Planctomycetota bacterium]